MTKREFVEMVEADIAIIQARLASEVGVSVAELRARAIAGMKKLRARRGLVVIDGGKREES